MAKHPEKRTSSTTRRLAGKTRPAARDATRTDSPGIERPGVKKRRDDLHTLISGPFARSGFEGLGKRLGKKGARKLTGSELDVIPIIADTTETGREASAASRRLARMRKLVRNRNRDN